MLLPVSQEGSANGWVLPSIAGFVVALAAVYAVLLAVKPRIPLTLEVYASTNVEMEGAIRVEAGRNIRRRNYWPFGREACTVGLLELYPNSRNFKSVILSSVCVQYGLTLNGKPPQYFTNRDREGDFILTGETVVGVREDGSYRYYRFVCP